MLIKINAYLRYLRSIGVTETNTTEIIKAVNGSYYNHSVPVACSNNAKVGILISRNEDLLVVSKLGNINTVSSTGNPTSAQVWEL